MYSHVDLIYPVLGFAGGNAGAVEDAIAPKDPFGDIKVGDLVRVGGPDTHGFTDYLTVVEKSDVHVIYNATTEQVPLMTGLESIGVEVNGDGTWSASSLLGAAQQFDNFADLEGKTTLEPSTSNILSKPFVMNCYGSIEAICTVHATRGSGGWVSLLAGGKWRGTQGSCPL